MKKRILLVVSVIGLLVVSGFTVVQYSSAQARGGAAPGTKIFERVLDDGNGPQTVTIIVEPASMLPEDEPAAAGVLAGWDGELLLVGTGNISIEVMNINGEISRSTNHSGPTMAVQLTDETQFYQDVTDIPGEDAPAGEYRLEQAIVPVDSLAGMGETAELLIYGPVQGNVVTADVVVYGDIE